MAEKPFIIAGGGIGGLAAALGLAKAGKHSLVLEQAERLGEIGAGIQIAPNAFNCFDFLGIGGALRENAVYIDRLRLMDALSGEEICHIPLDEDFRERFGNPYAVVHRADLHLALMEACRSSGKVEMRTRHAVCGYRQDENTVFVQVENRDEIEGTALIGADGLRSAVRSQMLDDDPPRVSGHTTYRSVIPTESMPEDLRWNAATLWAGPKCHIVHYPLKGWKVFNLVVTFHNDVREAMAGKPVSREVVEEGFEHIHPRPKQVIDHGTDWKLWVLCDRDPVRNWVDGRVALLGDAAHPMLQYFAQGACMAMEDAVSLSHRCRTETDLDKALALYLEDRMVRTSRVVIDSRLIGDHIYHPSGAAASVRNSVMRSFSPEDWYDRLEWLYQGGKPEG